MMHLKIKSPARFEKHNSRRVHDDAPNMRWLPVVNALPSRQTKPPMLRAA